MRYLDLVNIRQGTFSTSRFSFGNTLPLTQMPFGMASFAPQTNGNPNFFHAADRSVEGIRLTHQPSPWVGDFGCLLLIPQSGQPFTADGTFWSGYRPEEAVLTPAYQHLRLLRYRADFELTPTERGASIRLKYDGSQTPRLAIRPFDAFTRIELDPSAKRLEGYTTYHRFPVAENFALYFVMTFDSEIDVENTVATLKDGSVAKALVSEGQGAGLNIAFGSREVNVQLAVSFISTGQAEQNRKQELEGRSFEQIRAEAEENWEKMISKIIIKDKSEEKIRTFYSCMYRLFLFPNMLHEIDRDGITVHYSPYDGKVHPGVLYTNNGFWDTYRTVYPLHSLICPEQYEKFLEGFVNIYKESGWLPKWPSPAETGIMPGTLIDAVIADAAVKGIGSRELIEAAFAGSLKHSVSESADSVYGRQGVEDYVNLGYLPKGKYHESVNHTLDYAYGDFCIAQTAKVLGNEDIYREYMKRAQNYRRLFDPETGFMRGRFADGSMSGDFDPYEWGGDYTEGSAWQNSYSVFHDFDGLIDLMGGNQEFSKRLDDLFNAPPIYNVGGYACEIHEMTEMASVDFGQCAISNQPSFHIPYLYILTGEREKTNYWIGRITDELFNSGPKGFPGDEDNGSMAGWFIFSMLGFYPLCPGKAEYVAANPHVDSAKLDMGGHIVQIHKDYDGTLMLNGRRFSEDKISHRELTGKQI